MFEVKFAHLFYGFGYGIIFCAFLYNLIIYFNIKQKVFLYYCILQISILSGYIFFEANQYLNYDPSNFFIHHPIPLSLVNCAIISTMLFSKELLDIKKNLPMINQLLNVFILLHVIDFIGIFLNSDHILPIKYTGPFILILTIISGIHTLFIKKDKTAIFFILGWLAIFINVGLDDIMLQYIKPEIFFVLGFPLESIILSFALGYHIKQVYDEKQKKEQMLIHQNKLATMGGMLNNIAHQWRQPLANISFINNYLEIKGENETLEKKALINKIKESNKQLEFMSETIDLFKNFYQPKGELKTFYVSEAAHKAIDIINPSLNSSNIKLTFTIIKDIEIKAIENEYSQIVLNFLTNAKDILLQRDIKNPKIKITLDIMEKKSLLKVCDNAGGIENKNIDKVFEPYFSTKAKSSGIGLYMSKMIAQTHLNGEIKVSNTKKGACFSLII